MGKQAEADNLMKEAITVATEVELNHHAYQLLNQNQYMKRFKFCR